MLDVISLFSFVILFGSFHIFISFSLCILKILFYFIYVFMRDAEKQRYRQSENGAPCGEPDVGLDAPGSWDRDLSQSRCSTTAAPRCLADSIHFLLMGLFTFLFLPISVLIVCTFLGISPILPGLPVC